MRHLVIAITFAFSLSCSSAKPCSKGDTRKCDGPGACAGAQTCLEDGSGYSACDCGGTGGGSAGGSATGGGSAGGTAGGVAGGGAGGGSAGGTAGGTAGGAAGGTAGGTGGGAASPSGYQGHLAFLDLHGLDTVGTEVTTTPNIDIWFRDGTPLPACVGGGGPPCQLGVAGVDTCVTTIETLGGFVSSVNVGDISVSSKADSIPRDAGVGPVDVPSVNNAIPTCIGVTGEYECISMLGLGGSLAQSPVSGVSDFTGYTTSVGSIAQLGPGQLLFLATATGSGISGYAGGAVGSTIKVFGATDAGTAIQFRFTLGRGAAPVTLGAAALDDAQTLQVTYAGGTSPDGGIFTAQNGRDVPIGDAFTMTAATKAFLTSLDSYSEIGAVTAPLTLGCQDCGVSGPNAASGTMLQLDFTAGAERLTTTCYAPNSTSVTLPAAHWSLYRVRMVVLSSASATISRPNVVVDAPASRLPVYFSAGQGYTARFNTLVP